ncbi:S8 family peptidase [Asaia krungthepensis]|uniref:Subtilisin proteinase-like protein n=1 Tax=Asaia krungthepensis NRIC 0535 TaxID=1307925 RepID=A0ABQ0PWV9_9PROT|nr:S8 family peptidase [Asaia krungthepensis]GBQ83561.1 putative subtilisin proteinase-like protein [Asaia krungthepensis NRIC 0535]
MAESDNFDTRNRPHIAIDAFRETAAYKYPSRNQERKPLRGDYAAHAAHLLQQLDIALGDVPLPTDDSRLTVQGLKSGTVVEITTLTPAEDSRSKAIKIPTALEFRTQDVVVLRSERNNDRTESALLFVPDDARAFLQARISDYGRDPGNQRRPDVDRFEVVEEVRAIDAGSLFTGALDLVAPDIIWWELWVRQPIALADRLADVARNANIDVHEDRLIFPDTTVLFLHGAAATIATFAMRVPGAITEIRRATGTIDPFLDHGDTGLGQHDWVVELARRVSAPAQDAPVVCTLDTGIAASHPLIAPGLRGAWAYDAAWGADDHQPNGGHGTPLAGLVLYGDLEPLMNDARPVVLTHGAESMKLLPPHGFPPTKPPSYGVVTQGAISLVEIERPDALRSFCIATSATDFPPSRPSTWSGALDQIASGAMLGEVDEKISAAERPKRLMVVATGNVSGGMAVDVLPSQPLEDPSQSWNALTIGGFTRKEQPPAPPPVMRAAVPANHRSPFSRGSQSLPDDLTPIKPEVLFEAGNMMSDATGFCGWDPSVSLLSTGSGVAAEPLVPFWATSAAVGMAGHFVGQLQAARPDLWPETHRALTVDSAHWPEPVRKKFIGRGAHWKTGSKAEKQQHLREFGYGVPNIDRAILSARNDVTLVAQAEIQPFAIGTDGRTGVFNEMHFYDLPWPKAALEQLENEIVTMKVTLSYFIEPNLTGKAATRPDTYRSFGLRFDMKKRIESNARFRNRICASQAKDGTEADAETSCWLLGPKAIQAGSLHCDLWRGRAVDLAGHDAIAVYPVGGWWKSHAGQKRVADKARYALVISISAPGQQVDLYSEVTALVEAKEIEVLLG